MGSLCWGWFLLSPCANLSANVTLQVSTALATAVVLKALHQRANFYSACVYLAQSNANLMVRLYSFRKTQRLINRLDIDQLHLPHPLCDSPDPAEATLRTFTTD